MIPPQGTSSPDDVTTVVTDTPVLVQDPSPTSSSTPAKQEGTAAEPIKVSVEVHVVQDSDPNMDNVNGSPLTALAHTTLGTQTGSKLPRLRDPPPPPSRKVGEDAGRQLTLDPARPLAELVGRVRAHLSPTRGSASGGCWVPPLSFYDLTVLEGWISKLG